MDLNWDPSSPLTFFIDSRQQPQIRYSGLLRTLGPEGFASEWCYEKLKLLPTMGDQQIVMDTDCFDPIF